MKQTITRALGLVLVMTLLCGFLYTVVCTGINQVLFPKQANGSVIEIDGKTYGPELLAQQFTKPEHLWGRTMNLDLTLLPMRTATPPCTPGPATNPLPGRKRTF